MKDSFEDSFFHQNLVLTRKSFDLLCKKQSMALGIGWLRLFDIFWKQENSFGSRIHGDFSLMTETLFLPSLDYCDKNSLLLSRVLGEQVKESRWHVWETWNHGNGIFHIFRYKRLFPAILRLLKVCHQLERKKNTRKQDRCVMLILSNITEIHAGTIKVFRLYWMKPPNKDFMWLFLNWVCIG